MQKNKGLSMLVACLIVAGLLLTGCRKASKSEVEAFVGTWELAERTGSSGTADTTSLDFLSGFGFNVFLVLDENGTGSLELFGHSMDVTWLAKKGGKGTVTFEDGKVNMSLAEDGMLVLADGDQSLSFEKVDAAKTVKLDGSSEGSD